MGSAGSKQQQLDADWADIADLREYRGDSHRLIRVYPRHLSNPRHVVAAPDPQLLRVNYS